MRSSDRNGFRDWVSAAVTAVQLMTRVPLPVSLSWNERVGRRSIAFYPLAGFAVGLLIWAAFWAFALVLPSAPVAVLVVAVWVWTTGGLHLDGWMDTADALGSNRSRERMLEIMKDPRVGAMGVAAGVLLLLLKAALVYSLLGYAAAGSWKVGAGLAVVPVLARAFVPWAVVGCPYAGGSGGMGAILRSAGWRHALASLAVAAVCAGLVFAAAGDAVMLLPIAVGGALLTALGGVLGAVRLSRRIGGLTGDSYGALVEGLELLLLLALVALGN